MELGGDTKAVLFAAALMFMWALLLGVWKWRQMVASEAHPYVDTAHRAALMYSFALLLVAVFVELSGWGTVVNLLAAGALALYFYAAVAGMPGMGGGGTRTTSSASRRRRWGRSWSPDRRRDRRLGGPCRRLPRRPGPLAPSLSSAPMARVRIAALAGMLLVFAALPARAAGATWVVDGGGFGHGVGMSAYGAYGYGKHGAGYRQILAPLLPRASRSPSCGRAPMVRVLLDDQLRRRHASRGATSACGTRLDPARAYGAHRRGSSVRLLSSRRQAARALRRASARRQRAGRSGSPASAPTAARSRRSPTGGGSLNVVNRLNVNDYVARLGPGEVPPELADGDAAGVRGRGPLDRPLHRRRRRRLRPLPRHPHPGLRRRRASRASGPTAPCARPATRSPPTAARSPRPPTSPPPAGAPSRASSARPTSPTCRASATPTTTTRPCTAGRFRFSQAEMNSRLAPYVEGSPARDRGDQARRLAADRLRAS